MDAIKRMELMIAAERSQRKREEMRRELRKLIEQLEQKSA